MRTEALADAEFDLNDIKTGAKFVMLKIIYEKSASTVATSILQSGRRDF